jgi:nicotinate phosphoribosyltransferase
MVEEINRQFDYLCTLRFTEAELTFLAAIRFFKRDFIELLRLFQFTRKHIRIWKSGDDLHIEAEGPVYLVSYFEIFALSIVNEVYFFHTQDYEAIRIGAVERLQEKVEFVKTNPFRFTDFGTRRRFSAEWQEIVVKYCKENLPKEIFAGTSNVYLAMKLGLTPIGTMAHEFVQLYQGVKEVTLANSQKAALQAWVDEYRGDLGIALTDTLGFDKFLRDFDLYFAKLYDGVRHDSGDPHDWARKMIAHYKKLGIDPKTKQLAFSDGLDFYAAHRINRAFVDQALISFGIGTNLTNDFPGVIPLQIVMKIITVDGHPVAKISDNPAKTMSDDFEFVAYLKKVCKE